VEVRKPTSISRRIDPAHFKRASTIDNQMIGPYMDSIVMEMHIGLDAWRFGKDPQAELFRLALDAANALFAEAEVRGLA